MEFNAAVLGVSYQFYFINSTTVLVSGAEAEYIVYKNRLWNCADEIPPALLKGFAEVIESHQPVPQ